MSLTEKLDRLPPALCRLLARNNGRLMSDPELMRRTGWGKSKLKAVYRSTTFANVRVSDVDKFLTACGLHWSTQRRQRWLLKIAANRLDRMRHLRHRKGSPTGWHRSMALRHQKLLEKLYE